MRLLDPSRPTKATGIPALCWNGVPVCHDFGLRFVSRRDGQPGWLVSTGWVAVGWNDFTELRASTTEPEVLLAKYEENPEQVLREEFGWEYQMPPSETDKSPTLVRTTFTSEDLGL